MDITATFVLWKHSMFCRVKGALGRWWNMETTSIIRKAVFDMLVKEGEMSNGEFINGYTESNMIISIENCNILIMDALVKLHDVVDEIAKDRLEKSEDQRMQIELVISKLSTHNALVCELATAKKYLETELTGRRDYIVEVEDESE